MTRAAYKNWTFLSGLLVLFAGAASGEFPDWNYTVSLWMAGWTYLCAHWSVSVFMDRRYRHWPMALVVTWLTVDGSYWLYWSVVNPSVMIREGQWPMSLCLYLLCGFIWRAGPPYGFARLGQVLARLPRARR